MQRRKRLTRGWEWGIIFPRCRNRLAVWRQLPKLLPAGSTPVSCSKQKAADFCQPPFVWNVPNTKRESRVEQIAERRFFCRRIARLRKCCRQNERLIIVRRGVPLKARLPFVFVILRKREVSPVLADVDSLARARKRRLYAVFSVRSARKILNLPQNASLTLLQRKSGGQKFAAFCLTLFKQECLKFSF